jgi:hypothetical protein
MKKFISSTTEPSSKSEINFAGTFMEKAERERAIHGLIVAHKAFIGGKFHFAFVWLLKTFLIAFEVMSEHCCCVELFNT